MTEKIFYEDVYQKEFTASVLECRKNGDLYDVVLDRTCFYPEGGGQDCDTGVLSEAKVLHVFEKDGSVWHTCDKALEKGESVNGAIDWERRFMNMQQHSGEHIVSGVIKQNFGFDNVGFHMGKDYVTVDYSGKLCGEDLKKIEAQSNEAVYKDIKIKAGFPPESEVEKLSYRSKKAIEGSIRIVEVPEYDCCACCGTHVRYTGEIGAIKLIAYSNYKGGTRISMASGLAALKDYDEKNKSVSDISAALSAKPSEVAAAVERLKNENAFLRSQVFEQKKKYYSLFADRLKDSEGITAIFEDDMDGKDLKAFSAELCLKGKGVYLILSGSDEEGYKYALTSGTNDVRGIAAEINEKLSGRGGGGATCVMGSLMARRAEIEAFIKK